MVVFFGDHIPPFGEDVYAELGLSTTEETCYLTPYLIWHNVRNQPAKADLNAYELGARALSAAGLLDDPFLAHVESLRAQGAAQDTVYDLLSYDALFGSQYAYQEGALSPRNEAFQIGGEMRLDGFEAVQIGSAVYLRPQLARMDQRFQLSINGRLTDIPAVSADAGALALQCVLPRYNALPYNQSGVLTYDDAQDLLARSAPLPVRTVSALQWEACETRGSLTLYRTPVPESYFAVPVYQGEALGWQPIYGLSRSRQYAIDGGFVYLALSAADAPMLSELALYLLGE